MSTEEKKVAGEISASKKKREERKKKYKKEKRLSLVSKTIGIVIAVIIIGAIAYGTGKAVYAATKSVTPNSDYSLGLNEDGTIKGVKALDYVTLANYKNLQVPLSEVEFTDEEVEEDIQNKLDSNKELSEDTDAEVADGDTVSIDYVGSIDGVEFDGGNSNGEGYDLTIGSGAFIPGFEDQLIGHKAGETVTVEVTFPEDYQSAELAGQDAEFVVDIHGIYVLPEFTDEFVQENLIAYADTVEGYKEYLKTTNYEKRLKDYVKKAVVEESTVSKYPTRYLKQLERLQKYEDMESYEYMNQMYMSYYGQGYNSFYEYMGQTEEEYDAGLVEIAKDTEKEILVYQAIMESEGMKLTEQDFRDYLIAEEGSDDNYESEVESRGLGYCLQEIAKERIVQMVLDNCTVQ